MNNKRLRTIINSTTKTLKCAVLTLPILSGCTATSNTENSSSSALSSEVEISSIASSSLTVSSSVSSTLDSSSTALSSSSTSSSSLAANIPNLHFINLAQGKKTQQSSTDHEGNAELAVDGNINGAFSGASVSHTAVENQPWWQVDLGELQDIAYLNIWNRTDSCCSERLADFYVLISDTPFSSDDLAITRNQESVKSVYFGPAAASPSRINIGHKGRYIRIQLATTNALTLAEVEVFGKIEAENFHRYADSDTSNRGAEYRPEDGVDIQATTDTNGGYNIAWSVAGEWLEYDIHVARASDYNFILRLAANTAGKRVKLSIDGKDVGTVTAPANGWQSWQDKAISSVVLQPGQYTARITFIDGDTNFNWLSIADDIINRPVTYLGGGGTIAGALPVACDMPEGFTLVNALPDMISAMNNSDAKVALAPGTYIIDENNIDLFTAQTLPGNRGGNTLFPVNGNNSHYDFRCTKILFDTDLWRQFGGNEVIQLRTTGNFNTISHLTIEDIGQTSPSGGALGVMMDGRDNIIEGLFITSRGAQPYGLGDAYGKGGGPVLSHQKHSSVLIRGLRNTFKNSTVFNFSYGHSVFMQGSEDTLIDSIYVQGELRSTDDMLAANNPRFAAADARAASVDFITEWGYKLPSGYWLSLQEAGIRAYNGGQTIIDGVEYASRAAHNVTVLNSVVRHTRTGVTLAHATGDKYVENTTVIGCEQGYSIGSGNVVNSFADADVGPVLTFAYSSDNSTNIDITVLPTDGSKNGWGALAFIGGRNHNITLRSEQTDIPDNLQIVLSGDKHSIRHLENALQNQDQLTLTNTVINNLTLFPILINELANGVSGQSNGPITGKTAGNNLLENK